MKFRALIEGTGKYAPELRTGGLVGQEDTGTQFHGMARLSGPRASMCSTAAVDHQAMHSA